MVRVFAAIFQKFEDIAIGNPPKKWKFALFFIGSLYFSVVEKFVYFLPRTELYVNEQNTWEHINWHVAADYCGSLLCLAVAPFIDNYHLHWCVVLVCHGLISVVSVFYSCTLFLPPWAGISQASLLSMAAVTQFSKPIFTSYILMQLPERVGPPSKFLFTLYFSSSWLLVGVLQVGLRWATPQGQRSSSAINILSILLITAYPLFAAVFAFILIRKKDAFCTSESNPGDTFIGLKCINEAIRNIRGGCFGKLFPRFDIITIINSKKVSKVVFIILAMSFNSTLLRGMDIPWMFEYFTLNRSGVFVILEFSALNSFLTAIFIPLTEYGIIPLIRKTKIPIPIYSLMLCVAYIFTCLSTVFTIWMHVRVEAYYSTRLDDHNARVFLINTLDTYSYVVARGFTKTRIPSASIKSYLVGDDVVDGLIRVDFQIQNLYYGCTTDLVRKVKSKSTTAYVLTKYEVYEISADGLKNAFFRVVNDPTVVILPTLTFICPLEPGTGKFYEWCNATVELGYGYNRYQKIKLIEFGKGLKMNLPLVSRISITIDFPPRINVEEEMIAFRPVQSAKYVLLVWPGDISLKVRYRMITISEPPNIDPNCALPQIICRALGVSLGIVSLFTMFKINTPHSFFTIVVTILYLSEKIFIPIFVVMNHYNFREARYQLTFIVTDWAMFLLFILAVRVARA